MLPTRRQALGALGSGLFASAAYGQKNSPDTVAGIPVNYEEARVGTYTLPDPLTLNNGKRVGDATGYRPDAGGQGSRSCTRSVILCTPADTGPFRQIGMCI
jgi:hypothetical protein